MNKKLIQMIAIVCIGIGLFYLIKDYKSHFWFITMLFDDRYAPKVLNPLGTTILLYTVQVVLILRPIVGFGLLKLKIWGKNLTIIVLSVDFVLKAISFIHAHTYHPEIADKVAEMIAKGAVVVKVTSMIPSYIIAFISLVSVIYLLKVDVKELQE